MTALNIVIQKDIDGEYRVPAPCGTEAGSYYTDDREDALGTAAIIWKERGNVEFKVKSVREHS